MPLPSEPIPARGSDLELAALRERVDQYERLAAVGQLTAGILHEIRNPLNFIINYAQLSRELAAELLELLTKAAGADELADVLEMLTSNLARIHNNGERASRIIQSMLAQIRGGVPELVPTDLNVLLEEFTRLAYQGARAADASFNVVLNFQLDPQVGLVQLATDDFSRVVLNLVLNACQALAEHQQGQPAGYRATITVSSARTADGVQVSIRDNGPGMSAEVQRQLFTPFFTTKPVGQGTGLGLSISHHIVHGLHGGRLEVETVPAVFTEFRIWLPVRGA